MNIIKQLKRRVIPPCSQCKWFESNPVCDRCRNPKGLLLLEKLSGEHKSGNEYMHTSKVRATKYCHYEVR